MHQLNQKSIDALKSLRNYNCPKDNYQTTKRSAVLVALLPNEKGDLEVILTCRSSTLRTNAGDSAFPGGKTFCSLVVVFWSVKKVCRC